MIGPAPETAASPNLEISTRYPPCLNILEDMGIARLTESQGMPEGAITEEDAINIATELTWGSYRDEYLDTYPTSGIAATYNSEESVMGAAADDLPVWVVILEGWGKPASTCSIVGPRLAEGSDECITVKSSAYIIVDAVTGQDLASWHFGNCQRNKGSSSALAFYVPALLIQAGAGLQTRPFSLAVRLQGIRARPLIVKLIPPGSDSQYKAGFIVPRTFRFQYRYPVF